MNTLESSEEIVWIESEDGLPLDGVVIRPVGIAAKPIAVVDVHGFTESLLAHEPPPGGSPPGAPPV
jgi:hypothetical protein